MKKLLDECVILEKTLIEKSERLQAILDTTVDGIITIDERGIVLSFNKAAEEIFGFSASEVIGQNVSLLQPSPYRENHDNYIARYLETGEARIIGIGREARGRRKDGSIFPLYLAVSEVRVEGMRYFTGIVRDLTEQKKAVHEIRSLARFPEENPHPILRVARDGRLLYANATSKHLLDTWKSEVGQYLPDPWRQIVQTALMSGATREIEAECGEIIYSLVFTPIFNAEDVNVYGKDITERKTAEEALRASEAKHRALVQSSSDAIIMLDDDRRIVSFNRAFLDLFGLREEEAEGLPIQRIHTSEESFRSFEESAVTALETAGFFRTEWELKGKDGTIIPTEQTLSPISCPTDDVCGFVAIIRDITVRRRSEKELEQYREHLEEKVKERTHELEEAYKALLQEEKLKLLGTISAEMAHEIRNPLMSIGGFARRLGKKLPDVPEIGIMVEESQRLEGILRRIENYLKPVEMRPSECSVNDITQEAVGILSPDLAKLGVTLNMHLAPHIPPAYVDPGILIQVIINVMRNAAKVMDKRGMISVETFETDQNVLLRVRAPVPQGRMENPEHPFIPFGEDLQDVSVPVCFRMLRGMGGRLSLKQEQDTVVFAATLLKAFHPSSESMEKNGTSEKDPTWH